MDADFTVGEKAVRHAEAVAAAVQAGATGVGNGRVLLDAQREVGLDELVRDVGKARPQAVAVGAVAHRSARDTAEADLEQLEPLAALARPRVVAGVEQVR